MSTGAELVVEGPQPVETPGRGRAEPRVATLLDWLRDRVRTTPGRLALISVLVVAGALAFGLVATLAERSRAQAAQSARAETEPLLAQAATLYTSLSDANAAVSTALLTGGGETPSDRARYVQDLTSASGALADLTREAGTSASARAPLALIADQLPVYSGLVESARANNRFGFPIGAAYLRQASGMLATSMLPAADQIYEAEAQRLSDDYGSGTSSSAVVAFIAVVVVTLGLMVIVQLYVAKISRRIINIPLLGATLVLAVVSIWGAVGLFREQSALTNARRKGSDSLEVLSATRILLSRAQGDASLALVNRGSDPSDSADFTAVMQTLAPADGTGALIGAVAATGRTAGTSSAANEIEGELDNYRAQATHVVNLQNEGQIEPAILSAPTPAATSVRLGALLTAQIAAAQRRFAHSAAQATSALSGLWLAIPVMAALAAALALLGLRQRINEYR